MSDERDEELETLDARGLVLAGRGAGESTGLLTVFVFFVILSEIFGLRGTA